MKLLFVLAFLLSTLTADFIAQDGYKKVSFKASKNSQLNLADFRRMPYLVLKNSSLKVIVSEKNFDVLNAHFRLVDIYPKKDYSLKAKQIDKNTLELDLQSHKDTKVLQVFYDGVWNTVLLDKPMKILRNTFKNIDPTQKDLDVKQVQTLLKQARKAYPLDDKLKTLEMEINNRAANEFNKTSNHMEQGIIF